jgi:sugar phosphate isomerase/epimerase
VGGIRLGVTPDGRWELDGAALVTAAATAGFAAVGLSAAQADPACATALTDAGVDCHELLALLVTADEEATVRAATELASAAEAVRARWVLTVFSDGLGPDTVPAIARSAAILAEVGAGMAVEFSPLGPVTSIPDALDVVEAAGVDRAGVLIDTWHFFRGDSTWRDLATIPLERIAYLQFDDAPEPIWDNPMRETLHRRAMPGEGVFELERFASTLLERGWSGTVSLEVLNAELRELPVPEFLERAHRSAVRYWS